jgi:hypothetical protein
MGRLVQARVEGRATGATRSRFRSEWSRGSSNPGAAGLLFVGPVAIFGFVACARLNPSPAGELQRAGTTRWRGESVSALADLASCKKVRDDKGYWNQIESPSAPGSKPSSATASARLFSQIYPPHLSGVDGSTPGPCYDPRVPEAPGLFRAPPARHPAFWGRRRGCRAVTP